MTLCQVARIIASYKETNKEQRNKLVLCSHFRRLEVWALRTTSRETFRSGERPYDVVCSRYSGEDKSVKEQAIKGILHAHYAVLYRLDSLSLYSAFVEIPIDV